MRFSHTQLRNVRSHASHVLQSIGVKDLLVYEPHERSWTDLCKDIRSISDGARAMMAKVGEGTPEDRASEIENAFDVLMEVTDALNSERDVRTRIGNRSARQHGGDPRRPMGEDTEARSLGENDDFDDFETSSNFLTPDRRMSSWAMARDGDDRDMPSLGNFLRSMVTGPRTEVEKRALSEGSDSAGGYTVPTLLSASLIDRLRHASIVNRSGAITVPLGSDNNVIAKVMNDPVPAWRSENSLVEESGMTFDRVAFKPKSLAVLVKVSRELLEDSLNIGNVLPSVLAAALAAELDRVALFGTGADNEPRGVVNFANLTPNAFAGGDIGAKGYKELVRAKTTLRNINSDVTGFVMSVREEGRLSEMTDTTGQPLQPPKAIADIPQLSSTSIPTNLGAGDDESLIIAGDWRKLMIGVRHDIRIEVLRERYADYLQYGFLCHLRADVVAEHDQSFTVLRGITPEA